MATTETNTEGEKKSLIETFKTKFWNKIFFQKAIGGKDIKITGMTITIITAGLVALIVLAKLATGSKAKK